MTNHRLSLLLLLVVSLILPSVCREHIETTRQEVLSSRKKRTEQLETILNDAKQMLEDHKLGKRLLEEVEVLKLEKKVEIFQRKVEQMLGVPDDLEIERILLREKIRNERLDERRQQQAGAYQQDMEEEL